jgi:hypothetical protein
VFVLQSSEYILLLIKTSQGKGSCTLAKQIFVKSSTVQQCNSQKAFLSGLLCKEVNFWQGRSECSLSVDQDAFQIQIIKPNPMSNKFPEASKIDTIMGYVLLNLSLLSLYTELNRPSTVRFYLPREAYGYQMLKTGAVNTLWQ